MVMCAVLNVTVSIVRRKIASREESVIASKAVWGSQMARMYAPEYFDFLCLLRFQTSDTTNLVLLGASFFHLRES